MVRAADVNKDIKTIAEKVGTAVFSYDEIHNSNVNNTFHYDYQKVIDEMSRLNGRDMTDELIDCGILEPLPNGEYRVEVGDETKYGGGRNYGGLAFFYFSSKNYRTQYHELAHSLQRKYDLFNEEKMNVMYTKAEEKLGGKGDIEEKLIGRWDYSHYLREIHADSFACAALMLRAKNPFDFAYQACKTYSLGVYRNLCSLHEFKKPVYGSSMKYYTSYSVMKETIKQVFKIRKLQKREAFFDENGVLKDEKLARLCERAVIKSAYTPRTLNTLFKNKFFSKTSLHENGWRRDMVKSVVASPASAIFLIQPPSLFMKLYKHINLEKKERKEIKEINKVLNNLGKKEKKEINKVLNNLGKKEILKFKYQGTDEEFAALHRYTQLKFKENALFGGEISDSDCLMHIVKKKRYRSY